jgi:hypothetical protein
MEHDQTNLAVSGQGAGKPDEDGTKGNLEAAQTADEITFELEAHKMVPEPAPDSVHQLASELVAIGHTSWPVQVPCSSQRQCAASTEAANKAGERGDLLRLLVSEGPEGIIGIQRADRWMEIV